MTQTVTVTINGQATQAQTDETILSVADRLGIRIPTLCFMSGVPPLEQCGICAVEVEGQDALAYACAARVRDGMQVQTGTEAVQRSRRTALEAWATGRVV